MGMAMAESGWETIASIRVTLTQRVQHHKSNLTLFLPQRRVAIDRSSLSLSLSIIPLV